MKHSDLKMTFVSINFHKLSLNHVNKISEISSKDLITPSILSAPTYGALSSAMSVSSIIENKSIKKDIE